MKDCFVRYLALRYIGCVFFILLLFITGFGFYLYNNQIQQDVDNNAVVSRATLQNVSLALEDWVGSQVNLAKLLARSSDIVEACKNPTDAAVVAKAQKRLQRIHDTYGFYENIPLAVHLPEGTSLTLNINGEDRSVRDGTFFTDTVKGKTIGKGGPKLSFIQASRQGKQYFISQVYPSILRGNPIFVISVPVLDQNTHVGTLILAPQMDYFTDMFINKARLGETGSLFFIDDRGMFIAHKNSKMILKKDVGEHADYLQQIAQGSDDFYSDKGTDGTYRYLTQSINIPEQNILHKWVLCATQAQREIIANADNFAWFLTYTGGFMLLILAGVLYALTRFLVTRPLADVVEYAREIEQGNLSAKLSLQRKDEIGVLAESLRNMTVHIIGQLQEEMGFMQGILGGIQNPFAVVDKDMKIHSCSQSMVRITGREGSSQDFQGWNIAEFLFADKSRHVLLQDVMEDRQPRSNVPFTYTNPVGETSELLIDVVVLLDANGDVQGGITFWNDVTELKARQQAIESQKQSIEQAASRARELSSETETIIELLTKDIGQSNNRTEIQKGRLLETVTAIDELSATVQEIAESATTTAQNAQHTKEQADSGALVVRESMESIRALQGFVVTMQNDLVKLNEYADGIGNVMEIINDIADQTNLLALNAAIEAARAGEAGRGFSVVADEVRKLAEKTMAATSEVGSAVSSIQDGTKKCTHSIAKVDAEAVKSVTKAKETDTALTEIVGLAEATSQMVSSIATAAEQQATATEEIARTAGEVGNMAEETFFAMQESTKNVADVETSFKQLHEIVTDMR